MIPSVVVGQVTGTGAAINVVLGFKPDYVLIVNRTTGSRMERFRGAGTQSNKTVVAGSTTVVTTTASMSDIASATTGEGFTIPIDAQVNVAAQIIDYFAIRSGPGAS